MIRSRPGSQARTFPLKALQLLLQCPDLLNEIVETRGIAGGFRAGKPHERGICDEGVAGRTESADERFHLGQERKQREIQRGFILATSRDVQVTDS